MPLPQSSAITYWQRTCPCWKLASWPRVHLTQSCSLLPLSKTSQRADYLSILLTCRTRKQVSISGGVFFLWLYRLSFSAVALLSAWLQVCSQCQLLHLQLWLIYPKHFFFSFFLPQHTCFLGLVPIPITGRKEMPISISLLIWSLKCGYETLETGTL